MKLVKILTLVMVILVLSLGCAEPNEKVSVNASSTDINETIDVAEIKADAFKTSIGTVGKNKKIIYGRLTRIVFNSEQKDVLVFEDGTVVSAYFAQDFIWKMGRVHKIVVGTHPTHRTPDSVLDVEISD